jgi:hypothetical protein
MRKILFVAVALICVADTVSAQSAQRFSVQGSLLHEDVWGDAFVWPQLQGDMPGGFGAEGQLRYNSGKAISWGGGVQGTRHSWESNDGEATKWNADVFGFFLEPRYVLPVGGSSFAPYLAARLALTRLSVNTSGISGNSIGQTINGGGGVLVRLSSRVNLDLGATYGYTHFGEFGFENSNTAFEAGNGTNLITRVGLAFGIGK